MKTVSWVLINGKRSATHGVSMFDRNKTICGSKIGQVNVLYGDPKRPTLAERTTMCLVCWR
jgi:hypothetical protein